MGRTNIRQSICIAAIATITFSSADAAIRVVTWNVASDVDRNNDNALTAADGTYAVSNIVSGIQAMAARSLAGNAQPIDVLSLQELYDSGSSPSVTLTSIISSLNTIYGAGTYAYSTNMGDNTGFAEGNGPNGLIYNTKTMNLLGTQQIGTASGSGAARTPMRYLLQAKRPVKFTGMICSNFRASDDAATYLFNIPENLFAGHGAGTDANRKYYPPTLTVRRV